MDGAICYTKNRSLHWQWAYVDYCMPDILCIYNKDHFLKPVELHEKSDSLMKLYIYKQWYEKLESLRHQKLNYQYTINSNSSEKYIYTERRKI